MFGISNRLKNYIKERADNYNKGILKRLKDVYKRISDVETAIGINQSNEIYGMSPMAYSLATGFGARPSDLSVKDRLTRIEASVKNNAEKINLIMDHFNLERVITTEETKLAKKEKPKKQTTNEKLLEVLESLID